MRRTVTEHQARNTLEGMGFPVIVWHNGIMRNGKFIAYLYDYRSLAVKGYDRCVVVLVDDIKTGVNVVDIKVEFPA